MDANMNIVDICKTEGGYTVSERTFLPQDLLPKFLEALKDLSPEAYQQIMIPGCGHPVVPSYALEDHDSEWWKSEDCEYLLNEEVFDSLNEHAPEGFSFGSHEGDGACFGFWKVDDNG